LRGTPQTTFQKTPLVPPPPGWIFSARERRAVRWRRDLVAVSMTFSAKAR
jgi:hypothetical protein